MGYGTRDGLRDPPEVRRSSSSDESRPRTERGSKYRHNQGGEDPRRWRVLAVLVVALFMSLVGGSIVNVALPSIRIGLDANPSSLQWVLSGYALTFGLGLVTAGRAGDVLGRGPLFIAGVAIFTGASIGSGLADSAVWLNVCRAVQGLGSGLLSPQVIGMVQEYFRGAERGRAFGILGGAVGTSFAVGPLLGGVLIEVVGVEQGWRWTFFANVPAGIAAIVLALWWFPKPLIKRYGRRAGPDHPDQAGLDPIGAVLLGLAVLALLLPFVEGRSRSWVWLAFPVGLGLIGCWLRWERRQKLAGRQPMVDLAVFRVRSFANGTLLITLFFLGLPGVMVLVALYFQEGMGHSALESGIVVIPSAIGTVAAALWGGRRVARYGRKLVIAGTYCAILGVVLSMLVVWLRSAGLVSEWWLLASLAFIGVADGLVISPNQTLTLADAPLDYAGSSGGIMQTGQRIATSIGLAVVTGIAFAALESVGWSGAFIAGYAAIVVVMLLSVAVSHADLRYRRRHRVSEDVP